MEITEEELQKKIDEAQHFEQWRRDYLQGVRLVLPYLASMTDQYDPQSKQLIRRGTIEPSVYTTFEAECMKVVREYFPMAEKKEDTAND